jgi:hypothetical protein
MSSTKRTARLAGVLYLVNAAAGFFGIVYVPGRLIVPGNTAATARNILGSEGLFRLGMVSELVCAVEFIYLLWVLYRLLGDVNKTHAALMVMWGLAFIPVMAVNVLNEIAALTLLRGADFLSVLEQPRRESLAMLFLDLHRYGYAVGWIFGPWLLHLGALIYRSGFLPKILGVLLIAAGFGYLADSGAPLLLPSYANLVGRFASLPLMVAEPATILWLLIVGAKTPVSTPLTT